MNPDRPLDKTPPVITPDMLGPYDHNQISTHGRVLKIGGVYQYKEDSHISQVELIADESNDENIGFKLKVLKHLNGPVIPVGTEFSVSAARGRYAYNGMWRIYDDGEYVTREDIQRIIAERKKEGQ